MAAPLAFEVAGAGPPLVLLHGFTQNARAWGPVADRLAEHHRLLLVDAPGHGRSSHLDLDLPTTAAAVADLVAAEVGGPAAVLGYSMGGRLALHLALAHPDAVRALVLVGATAGLDDAEDRAARRAADEALAASIEADGVDAFLERWLAQPLFADLPPEASQLDARRQNTAAGLASSLRRAGTGTMDPPLWGRLGEVTAPTLVVVGEQDPKFSALGERLVAGLGGPAERARIADAGHACHLTHPDAFTALVTGFLRRAG